MSLVLVLTLAGQRVALLADEMESVVEIEAIAPVPGAAPHIAGLSALRSRVLTVVDARASLGLGTTESPRDAVVAIVDGHPYALLVDTVEDVVEGGDPRPLAASAGPGWSRVARGTVEAEGDLMLLLDLPALIAGPIVTADAA
jgi:purine-binding chemotaxis protein CheW